MGRKGKYGYWISEEGLLLVGGWSKDGLTEKEISEKIGINPDTLNEWKNRFPEFSDAIKKNKEWADRRVENSLFKRATGYEYVEETQELRFDKNTGEYVLKTTKRVKKHMPPDTTAQIFWLKNRKPASWRNNPENGRQEAQGDDGFLNALNGTAEEDWSDEAT